MVSLQSHFPHAVHWVWSLATSKHHRGVADHYQHDGGGYLLRSVYWQHVYATAVY